MNMFVDMFKPKQPETSAKPEGGQTENKALSDVNVPLGEGKIPGSELKPINPLDVYSKMFDNANKSSNIEAPSFKLDPATLKEVSSSMDFSRGVNPALVEKAMSGDAKSIIDMMQEVGRNAYSASLEHATSLTEAHLGQRAAYENSKINSGVRQQLTSDALSSVPSYTHPVAKQALNDAANRFASANPDASPKEVAQAAQRYLQDLAQSLNPQPSKEQQQRDSGGMDWSKYLS